MTRWLYITVKFFKKVFLQQPLDNAQYAFISGADTALVGSPL